MTAEREGKDGRGFVPLEVASFLRAPYGWTNRMRREEGAAGYGERRPMPLGLWTSLGAALAAYGPLIVGGLVGWHRWGGWGGAGLGALVGLTVQAVVLMAALPVMLLVRSRRSR